MRNRVALALVTGLIMTACGADRPTPGIDWSVDWSPEPPATQTPEPAQPRLDSVSPSRASAGTLLRVDGLFPGTFAVRIAGNTAQIEAASTDELRITGVPEVAVESSVAIQILVDGEIVDSLTITALPRGQVDVVETRLPTAPRSLALAMDGALWFSDASGLFRIDGDGVLDRMGDGFRDVRGLAALPDGRMGVTVRLENPPGGGSDGALVAVTHDGVVQILKAGLTHPTALTLDTDGNRYVLEGAANRISKITPTGSTSTFAFVNSAPTGSDVVISGEYLYLSTKSNDTIERAALADGNLSTFAIVPDAGGMTVDAMTGEVLASADVTDGTVVRVAGDGTVSTEIAAPDSPLSAVADLVQTAGGYLLSSETDGRVIDLIAGQSRVLAQRLSNVSALATVGERVYAASADACAGAWTADGILELREDGRSRVVASVSCPGALAPTMNGSLLVSDYSDDPTGSGSYDSARILRVDPTMSSATMLVAPVESVAHSAITVAEDGSIFAVDSSAQTLGNWTSEGAAMNTLPLSAAPTALAVRDGNVVYTDSVGGGLYEVAMMDGTESQITTSTPLTSPWGVATADNGDLLIVDSGAQRLVRVTPGGDTEVAADLGGTDAAVVAIDPSRAILTVDEATGAVLRIAP